VCSINAKEKNTILSGGRWSWIGIPTDVCETFSAVNNQPMVGFHEKTWQSKVDVASWH
jgi:hypothetical protein